MRSFYYKALDNDGDVREGMRVAHNKETLTNYFEEQGLTPVKLEQRSSFWKHPVHHKERLSRFFRNLHMFLKSGMELLPALELVKNRLESEQIQACVETIIDDLRKGRSFGDSLATCEPYFPASAHRICAVAEETGNLREACDELADYFKSQHEFLNNLYSMLLYPFIVLIVGIGITVFLFTVVVPRLQRMVPSNQSLPMISEIVFSIGEFMSGWGFWAVIAAIVLLPVLIFTALRTNLGQRLLNNLLTRSDLYRSIKSQLFCLAMSMCLRVGMEITRALELGREVLGETPMAERMGEVIEEVRQGHALTDSLANQGFDEIPLDSLKAGEESGNLGEVFAFQAELLDEDINHNLSRLVTIIEPVVILTMAVFVGVIMSAVLLPIFEMSSTL